MRRDHLRFRITPQISDALMRETQNTFMPDARSPHLLVMRHPRNHEQFCHL